MKGGDLALAWCHQGPHYGRKGGGGGGPQQLEEQQQQRGLRAEGLRLQQELVQVQEQMPPPLDEGAGEMQQQQTPVKPPLLGKEREG